MVFDLSKFKPNLAASPPKDDDPMAPPYDWANFPFASGMFMASPKIDGIRVVCHPTLGPVTRSLLPVANEYCRKLLSRPELRWLDGEIVLNWDDPHTFNKTQSAVMSHDGEPAFEYRVFDNFEAATTCGFGVRLTDAQHVLDNLPQDIREYVKMTPHIEIESYEQFAEYEEWCVTSGFEGVMLRHKGVRYKFGRSTWKEQGLIKVKRFVDAEGIIEGWEPLERNQNEPTLDNLGLQKRSSHQAGMQVDPTRIGKFNLLVTTGAFTGSRVDCGSGLTDAQRLEYAAKFDTLCRGQTITFKYQEHGSKDAPRLPIFKGIRYD